jgi:hypothetical protein
LDTDGTTDTSADTDWRNRRVTDVATEATDEAVALTVLPSVATRLMDATADAADWTVR